MGNVSPRRMPWVIFDLMDGKFALSAGEIREMAAMPPVTRVPGTPAFIRGVINLRGRVIPVTDLRMKLGMVSRTREIEDLVRLMTQREQDHKNWIAELEASVTERRAFKLATDPHQCAFGKWYDHYRTDNRMLASCLRKFDDPHKKIHGIADEVKKLEEEGDFKGALDIIHRTREKELSEMVRLFAEARDLIRKSDREIALILEAGGRTFAVCVDAVESVEKLDETGIQGKGDTAFAGSADCITGIARRADGKGLVQLLRADGLVEGGVPPTPADADAPGDPSGESPVA